MFIIDVSPSMGDLRTVELPPGPDGEPRSIEMTNLEWSLKYVKLKIQQMVRKNYFMLYHATDNGVRYLVGERQIGVAWYYSVQLVSSGRMKPKFELLTVL